MFEFVEKVSRQGWQLSKRSRVLQCHISIDELKFGASTAVYALLHLFAFEEASDA